MKFQRGDLIKPSDKYYKCFPYMGSSTLILGEVLEVLFDDFDDVESFVRINILLPEQRRDAKLKLKESLFEKL